MTDKTDAELEAEAEANAEANAEAGERLADEILPLVRPKFDGQTPRVQALALFSLAIELLDEDEADLLGDLLSGYNAWDDAAKRFDE
jgi:hypothetical protein